MNRYSMVALPGDSAHVRAGFGLDTGYATALRPSTPKP